MFILPTSKPSGSESSLVDNTAALHYTCPLQCTMSSCPGGFCGNKNHGTNATAIVDIFFLLYIIFSSRIPIISGTPAGVICSKEDLVLIVVTCAVLIVTRTVLADYSSPIRRQWPLQTHTYLREILLYYMTFYSKCACACACVQLTCSMWYLNEIAACSV